MNEADSARLDQIQQSLEVDWLLLKEDAMWLITYTTRRLHQLEAERDALSRDRDYWRDIAKAWNC